MLLSLLTTIIDHRFGLLARWFVTPSIDCSIFEVIPVSRNVSSLLESLGEESIT